MNPTPTSNGKNSAFRAPIARGAHSINRPSAPPIRPPLQGTTGAEFGKRPEPDATLLSRAVRTGETVTVVFMNGDAFAGKVVAFGSYNIRFAVGEVERLIYKHALAEIVFFAQEPKK